MTTTLAAQLASNLAQFSSTSRLFQLTIGDDRFEPGSGDLLVEGFLADEKLNGLDIRDLIVLSIGAHPDLEQLLGQAASLHIILADGSRSSFSGEISEAAVLGCDGGFARYRIRISPWLWRLGQVRNSRIWQDKTAIDIIDSVFETHLPWARWRWSDDISSCMAESPPRDYCCQYRESDYDFVRRILAEEGMNWRFEQTDEGPAMVLFADSSLALAVPQDPSSEMDGGIHYHGAGAIEHQDSVQALVAQQRIHASLTTVLSYDYRARQIVAASSPTRLSCHRSTPDLETYDVPGHAEFKDRSHARNQADLRMEGQEARSHVWRGRSTVRTLRPGTRLDISGVPLQEIGESSGFTVLRVTSMGVNNLPPPARHALAELFGSVPELLPDCGRTNAPDDLALVIGRAVESGYANCFEAVPAALPWRPALPECVGGAHAKPTAMGAQSAIVVGPDGRDEPCGANELHCDRLGRVCIRFHWQDGSDAGCWVRVAQRAAGGRMGSQFLPRIGQEVLVQFLDNDIDQPIVVGALYNGQGEGGIAPTPGGRTSRHGEEASFARSTDHATSAQANLAGGNSPAWHGASGDSVGQRNAAAQWGVRSQELGGVGYNQLLFDDTDAQGRVQLKSTHAATEFNLGHLIHSADNYRGSFRGLGAKLHTDAYGAVRAAGLLVTSHETAHDAIQRGPVGENMAGIAALRQGAMLAASYHSAATTHQTVGLAAHAGSKKANASVLDDENATVEAMLASVANTVDRDSLDRARADAAAKNSAAGGNDKLPYSRGPIMTFAAKHDFSASTGQSLQLANGEILSLMSGQDAVFIGGGQWRLQTGQVVGALAGVVKAGDQGIGLQMITAANAIDIQSQTDVIEVQARDEVKLTSVSARVDLAAAKRVSLSTAGGASITIEGGNITVLCPGKFAAHAGKKSFLVRRSWVSRCRRCRAVSVLPASRNPWRRRPPSRWWNDMLIDAYAQGWLDDLHTLAAQLAQADQLYVLVDGAFIPGLHKRLSNEHKAILFASLSGCTEEAADASPFLAPYDPADKTLLALLRHCDRWPMLSVIATPESLAQLAQRLSSWCVVEVDGQAFNFRFPDTRRLPAIAGALTPMQKTRFFGPATGWTYVARDGCWCVLPVEGGSANAAEGPVLDERQFAVLVEDSHADELIVLLGDRGHEVYRHPSRTHALVSAALDAARTAGLDDTHLNEWCEWFWKQDLLCNDSAVIDMLQEWQRRIA